MDERREERRDQAGVLVDERPNDRELRGDEQRTPTVGGPLNVRNFRLLFGGQTISTLGDVFYVVALPWVVLTTGGGAQELGSVLAAYGIPRAVSMLAGGWLSDRLRPRRVMLVADAIRLLLVALLAAIALQGHPNLVELCAIAVPLGAFGGVFLPASQSIVPETLSSADLHAGNGLMMASQQGANLLGSALAGVVVAAFTAAAALAIDAGTFLVSALSLALMCPPQRGRPAAPGLGRQEAHRASAAPRAQARQETQEQADQRERSASISLWRFLGASRLIQGSLLIFALIGLVSGGLIEVALPALVHGPLHANATAYGAILAGWGAGALAGAFLAGALGKHQRKGMVMLLAGLLMSALIALAPTWGIPGAVVCMLIAGVAGSTVNVLLFTAVQLAIPRHLMGRVMGLLLFSSFGVYPLSVALAGTLAAHLGPAVCFTFSGRLLGVAMLFGMTQRALRAI